MDVNLLILSIAVKLLISVYVMNISKEGSRKQYLYYIIALTWRQVWQLKYIFKRCLKRSHVGKLINLKCTGH